MISNNFTGIGRLTRDPELNRVNDKSVLNFSIAINDPFSKKDHPEADFIDCVAWGIAAENIAKYFSKGDRIGVSGRVRTGNFEDKDGNKRKKWEVNLDSFEFIENKKDKNKSTEDNHNINNTSNDTENSSEEDEGDLPF